MVNSIINTGYIAPLFIVGALPMLHPFNACLGPDENQKRTLTLAVEAALMSTVVFGILSMMFFKADLYVSCVTIVLGLDRLGIRVPGLLEGSQGFRSDHT